MIFDFSCVSLFIKTASGILGSLAGSAKDCQDADSMDLGMILVSS